MHCRIRNLLKFCLLPAALWLVLFGVTLLTSSSSSKLRELHVSDETTPVGAVVVGEECTTIYVAAFVVSASSTIESLYSTMQTRDRPLELHLFACDPLELRIVKTFLDSWRLPQLVAHYYNVSSGNDTAPRRGRSQEICERRCFRSLMESTQLSVVMLLRDDVRFTSSWSPLWDCAMEHNVSHPSEVGHRGWQAVVLSLSELRRRAPISLREAVDQFAGCSVECGWRSVTCSAGKCSCSRDRAIAITSRDHDLLRDRMFCVPEERATDRQPNEDPNLSWLLGDAAMRNDCHARVTDAVKPRRVHLYWRRALYPDGGGNGGDVHWRTSLAIQTSLNRLRTIRKTLERWRGVVHVAVLLEQSQLPELAEVVDDEWRDVRDNVNVHVVVHRGGRAYPTNVLRNVALREVTTPYVLSMDADFLPSVGLERVIESQLPVNVTKASSRPPSPSSAPFPSLAVRGRVALVVPAFMYNADKNITSRPLPSRRGDLLREIRVKRACGYNACGGWSLGHRPTNYARWTKYNGSSYEVTFREKFEPYVVVATGEAPEFEEAIPNRMSEKYFNALQLHLRGFHFRVVTNGFLLHLPHERHNVRTAAFARCHSLVWNLANLRASRIARDWTLLHGL